MPYTLPMAIGEVAPRRRIYLAVGIVTLVSTVVAGGLIFPVLTRPPASTGETPQLDGALRAGTPEFERYRERLVIDSPEATASPRALGDLLVELKTNVRNETGRRIDGLEMRGVVLNAQGTPVGERIAVIIPLQQTALEPGEEMSVRMLIEGVSPDAERAGARVEVTGLRFD